MRGQSTSTRCEYKRGSRGHWAKTPPQVCVSPRVLYQRPLPYSQCWSVTPLPFPHPSTPLLLPLVSSFDMARTKQTARRSTGCKTPQQMLAIRAARAARKADKAPVGV